MSNCFTTRNSCRVNALMNRVSVVKPKFFNNGNNKKNVFNSYVAIWDTGATATVISRKIVDDCGLIATGMVPVSTAGGVVEQRTYVVDVILPNNVIFPNLTVTEAELNGADMLIGMDIIGQGDFHISNFEGKTNFSFRLPSCAHADFIQEEKEKRTVHAENRPNRNSKCPCGSGKKYKACCGA